MDLDTSTPIGRIAVTIFAAFGQVERDMAVERINSGMVRVRGRGVRFGSDQRFTDQAIAEAYELAGTVDNAAEKLGCSRITIIRGLQRIKAAKEQQDG